MLNQLKENASTHGLFEPNDQILLAVSGGVDSMVMLNLFVQLNVDIFLAHCNFSLRGCESDADEALVADIAQKNGLRLFTKRFETKEYAQTRGISVQMAARELRYGWFNELCIEHSFKAVAVAHNANDNAETLLLNLARGSGLKGLSGIRPKFGRIIRPLLFASREAIERYASENGVEYRTDSSNSDTKYARNLIRHRVIPELSRLNPSVTGSINLASQNLSQAWWLVSEQLDEFRSKVCKRVGDELHYSVSLLQEYPHRGLFLAEELMAYGFPASIATNVERSLKGQPGKVFYGDNYQLIRDRDALIISPKNDTNGTFCFINSDDTSVQNTINLTIEKIIINSKFSVPTCKSIAALDFNKLTFPLTLRLWKPGDWFVPLGMNGRKKVSDYMIDRKIPIHDKQNVHIIESNGQIVWIVGYRIDNRFRVTPETKEALMVRLMSG